MQETGTLGSLGAEIIIDTSASEIFAVDLTGDFKGRVEMQGSIDGVDFMPIQVKPYGMIASTIYSHIIEGAGAFVGCASGALLVKTVVTKYVSGSFDVTINAPTISSGGGGAGGSVTVTASVLPTGAATQATLASVDAKLPALSGGAVPVTVTASTLPAGAATDATLSALNTKIPAQAIAGLLPVDTLGTPGVPRVQATAGIAATVTLTTTCRRVSMFATQGTWYSISGTATATSHYIGAGERLDFDVPASTAISVLRETTDGFIRITELL
jgi:hypothetical protein